MPKTILKVLVGSRAHGLNNENSDFDYRGVFVEDTKSILSIKNSSKNTNWIEGKVDDTSWEIGHFLKLALKCNPTILETFLSPVVKIDPLGEELRELFPYIWNKNDVLNAFRGYAHNQRKKLIEEKDGNPFKFASAYARVLYNAYELISTGTFTIRIIDIPKIGESIKNIKDGKYSTGSIIDFCKKLEMQLLRAYDQSPDKIANERVVDEFLLKVRIQNL